MYSVLVVGFVVAPLIVVVALSRHRSLSAAGLACPPTSRHRLVTFLHSVALAVLLESLSLLSIHELADPINLSGRDLMSALGTALGVSPIIVLHALRRERRVALSGAAVRGADGGRVLVASDVFMGLRTKSLLLTVCAAAVVMMVLRWATEESRLRSFERLEIEDGLERAAAGRNAVLAVADSLRSISADWGVWDETYEFVVDRNTEYTEQNLGEEALRILHVTALLWLDTEARIVASAVLDADGSGKVPLPSAYQQVDWARIAALVDETRGLGGVLEVGGSPYLVGISPILRAERRGPRRGSLVMLRALDASTTSELSGRLGMPLSFAPADSVGTPLSVEPVDADRLACRFILPDLLGTDRLTGTIISHRRIASAGRQTLRSHTLEIAAAGGGFALVTFLVLSGLVVGPVRRLSAAVDAVRTTRDASVRVPVEGNDEVGRLAAGINGMLGGLDDAARELQAAKMVAEAASRAKATFLANMSHEIRTPMTAILGYTDLIVTECVRGPVSAELDDYAKTIKRNGEHLLAIINDILDVSKIESGKMSVESLIVDLGELVSEVVALMQLRVAEKGLGLAVERTSDLPTTIRTDPVRLRQILINLLGNAVKFTETGGVTLNVSNGVTATGERAIRFEIIDTGVGLAPEYLSRLFGAFEQADPTMTRRFGGTGLGLRVSRSLARLLGGDITVSSEPGRGSVFTVVVASGPVEVDTLERITSPEIAAVDDGTGTPRVRTPLAGRRIFLAEDGLDNQRLIAFYLKKSGAVVRVFDNGRLALEALTTDGTVGGPLPATFPCDLVLTDMQMPEMDGYTLAMLLRAKGYQGPIGALTAHVMDGAATRCLDAGCNFYLMKPVNKAQLVTACVDALAAPSATSKAPS